MNPKDLYLRFLNIIHAINGQDRSVLMDSDAEKLLEVIAINHAKETPLTVSAAMGLSYIASPATIHRKLDILLELGMIESVLKGKNRRTKYLVPTQLADYYFASMGEAMNKAQNNA